jgi:hypothetical protein
MLRNVTLCARFRPTTPGGGYLSKSYAPSVLLRNPALEAFCCTYGGPDMAARTHVDRIPRDPGPIAYAALDSDSRATGYYAPRSANDVIDLLISVCYHTTMDKGDQKVGLWNGGSTRFAGSSAEGRPATSSVTTRCSGRRDRIERMDA